MAIRLELRTGDVTQLPDSRPSDLGVVPERIFSIEHSDSGYQLKFDGGLAMVPDDAVSNLLTAVSQGTSVEWRHSTDPEIQTTFRPLKRILQRLNSTPSYQLFLAGFHIGDAIGLFQFDMLEETAICDSFRYLVGTLAWQHGKRGRLFFIPDGYADADAEQELLANNKLIVADLYSLNEVTTRDEITTSLVAHKLCIPYATPLGFNTTVGPETESAWRRICELVRRQGGGPVQ